MRVQALFSNGPYVEAERRGTLSGREYPTNGSTDTKAYPVGGGTASLARAAYLTRDGGLVGANICLFEETQLLWRKSGACTCTFDVPSFIPSLTDAHRTVRNEIHAFNEQHVSNAHARLVRGSETIDATIMGFTNRGRVQLVEFLARSEDHSGPSAADMFNPSFFTTSFRYMRATTSARRDWYSAAELRRFYAASCGGLLASTRTEMHGKLVPSAATLQRECSNVSFTTRRPIAVES